MDGLTLVLRYENGHLKQAITRGRDGIIGEDVTHTVKTFLNVPLTIPISEAFEVRGEGVISWKNFDTINADLDDAYSHPRNLAAGSVRKLDASEAQKRMLEFWAFDLVSDSLESGSKHAQQKLLAYCGFKCGPISVSAFLMQRPGDFQSAQPNKKPHKVLIWPDESQDVRRRNTTPLLNVFLRTPTNTKKKRGAEAPEEPKRSYFREGATLAFTEYETEQLRKALLKETRRCAVTLGMKKTSVDQLTKAVGIAKGSFYKFYESKEMLFFAVLEGIHLSFTEWPIGH